MDAGTIEYENQPEGVSWGAGCYGTWLNWTTCNEECYSSRTFQFQMKDLCPDVALQDGEQSFRLCVGHDCPLAHASLGPLADMVSSGLNSLHVQHLGSLLGQCQIWLQCCMLSVICVLAFVQSFGVAWMPDICVVVPISAAWVLLIRFYAYDGIAFGAAGNGLFSTLVGRIMYDMLIPISIFEGAFHMQRKNFLAQFGTGVVFAVFGTLFSCVLIAAMVKYSGDVGAHPVTSWREALTYAAFIADVDPVATLSIFSGLQVDPLLQTLVGGEATLNDPAALVLFGLLNAHTKGGVDELMNLKGAQTLVVLLGGSIVLGVLVGVVLTLAFRIFNVADRGPLEAAYFLVAAFTSFCLGEFVGMSGIIVALFCGIFMGKYTSQLAADIHSVDSLLCNVARLADVVVFMLIGAGCFLIDEGEGVKLGVWTVLFCFLARAIMVGLFVPAVNQFKIKAGRTPINPGQAFMIFHSGLRGGMTMMMALMVDPYWSKNQNSLVVGTVVCVVAMAYLCGCTGPFFLRLVGVPMNVPQEKLDISSDAGARISVANALDRRLQDWLVGRAAHISPPEPPVVGRSLARKSAEVRPSQLNSTLSLEMPVASFTNRSGSGASA